MSWFRVELGAGRPALGTGLIHHLDTPERQRELEKEHAEIAAIRARSAAATSRTIRHQHETGTYGPKWTTLRAWYAFEMRKRYPKKATFKALGATLQLSANRVNQIFRRYQAQQDNYDARALDEHHESNEFLAVQVRCSVCGWEGNRAPRSASNRCPDCERFTTYVV